jgi:ABC-type molybdate transport system permease subunit
MMGIEFDMQEAHNLSIDFLQYLESEDCVVGMGAVVAALTLGRLLSPKSLSMDEELAFVQAMVEFGATFFVSGEVN